MNELKKAVWYQAWSVPLMDPGVIYMTSGMIIFVPPPMQNG
jgi:hypothetical protein